jgi:hypothetical protein
MCDVCDGLAEGGAACSSQGERASAWEASRRPTPKFLTATVQNKLVATFDAMRGEACVASLVADMTQLGLRIGTYTQNTACRKMVVKAFKHQGWMKAWVEKKKEEEVEVDVDRTATRLLAIGWQFTAKGAVMRSPSTGVRAFVRGCFDEEKKDEDEEVVGIDYEQLD